MNFRLARDQVVLLETTANLWASQSKGFFSIFSSFELGGICYIAGVFPATARRFIG